MKHASLQKCIAVALALAVWQGAAMAVGMDLLLPSPWQVAQRLWTVWQEPDFFPTVAFSLLRISGGFGLGLVLGVLLAVAAGWLRVLEILLWPYVTVIKSVPVASFIIICLIWLNTSSWRCLSRFSWCFRRSTPTRSRASAAPTRRCWRWPGCTGCPFPAAGVYLRSPGEAVSPVRVQRGPGHVVEVRRGRRGHRCGGRFHR